MHYYQHHIGDFTRDTAFLTNEEMGIYLKLIWIYYDTEKPLENNIEKLAMKVNSRQNPTAVEHLLKMFFELKENEWHHKRCEEVIRDFYDLIDKKSNWLYKSTVGVIGTFWSTVVLVEFMDMAFSRTTALLQMILNRECLGSSSMIEH